MSASMVVCHVKIVNDFSVFDKIKAFMRRPNVPLLPIFNPFPLRSARDICRFFMGKSIDRHNTSTLHVGFESWEIPHIWRVKWECASGKICISILMKQWKTITAWNIRNTYRFNNRLSHLIYVNHHCVRFSKFVAFFCLPFIPLLVCMGVYSYCCICWRLAAA